MTSTNEMKLLRKGSKNCPKDKEPLLWAQLCGIRTYRAVEGGFAFRAKCPKCKIEYQVRAK